MRGAQDPTGEEASTCQRLLLAARLPGTGAALCASAPGHGVRVPASHSRDQGHLFRQTPVKTKCQARHSA